MASCERFISISNHLPRVRVPTFAKAHFGHPSPSSRQKLNGTNYNLRCPDSSCVRDVFVQVSFHSMNYDITTSNDFTAMIAVFHLLLVPNYECAKQHRLSETNRLRFQLSMAISVSCKAFRIICNPIISIMPSQLSCSNL